MGGVIEVLDPLTAPAKLIRTRRLLSLDVGAGDAPSGGPATEEEHEAPAPPPPLRARLAAFYARFNRAKLPHLDEMAAAWAEKEPELEASLKAKAAPPAFRPGPPRALGAPLRHCQRKRDVACPISTG